MKSTHKKIIGLFGLILVAIITIFAAYLPSPRTLAADSDHVTDNISVRVLRSNPTIGDLEGIEDGSISPDGRHTVLIPYSGVESIIVKILYTDANGDTHVTTLPAKVVNYEDGIAVLNFNTLTGDYDLDGDGGQMVAYGYGDYVIEVIGIGSSGEPVGPKTVGFETNPIGDGTQIVKEEGAGDNDSDKYYLDVDYGNDGDMPGGADVDHIVVKIFDEDGNQVDELVIIAPDTRIEVPFEEYGDGIYKFELTPYDADGNVIYKSPAYTLWYTYTGKKPLPVPSTADTGGLMGNLNISKTDYIITGLIIFGIIGIAGAVIISKHDKKARNKH